jgi:hypothetical protein
MSLVAIIVYMLGMSLWVNSYLSPFVECSLARPRQVAGGGSAAAESSPHKSCLVHNLNIAPVYISKPVSATPLSSFASGRQQTATHVTLTRQDKGGTVATRSA